MLCDCARTHFFFTVLTPTPSVPRWDVPPHTPTWMWQVSTPPPPPTSSSQTGPSCVTGASGPLQEEHHTSHNNRRGVFPGCPPTSLSIRQRHLLKLGPRSWHRGREDGETVVRVREINRRKTQWGWLFVLRGVRKMPASSQVSCLVHSLAKSKRMKCLLWQRYRLWQREMQTQGGLG